MKCAELHVHIFLGLAEPLGAWPRREGVRKPAVHGGGALQDEVLAAGNTIVSAGSPTDSCWCNDRRLCSCASCLRIFGVTTKRSVTDRSDALA